MGQFLTGKKTYLGAAILAIAGLLGYLHDVYTYETALAILGLATVSLGLGDKYDRFVVKALELLKAHKEKGSLPE